MGEYKRIERLIGTYLASRYRVAVEIGVGRNFVAAAMLQEAGAKIRCTDIKSVTPFRGIEVYLDDIFFPDPSLYRGADLLYSIRPAVEMIPPMVSLARVIDADLLVYHLGFEQHGDGGEILDCGVPLHRYHRRSEPAQGRLVL